MEYTNNEKALLKMLFELTFTFVNSQDGYLNFTSNGGEYMSENEIFALKEKLGFDD